MQILITLQTTEAEHLEHLQLHANCFHSVKYMSGDVNNTCENYYQYQ